jgi:hypothetical protein
MERKEFARLALAVARAEYPEQRWALQDNYLVGQTAAGQHLEVSLGNLHARTAQAGDIRADIRSELAALQGAGRELAYGDWAAERESIFPLLLPAGFLTSIEKERARRPANERGGLPAALCAWHGDLCISCVLDRPSTMIHVGRAHLDAWQVDAKAVFAQAKVNLEQRNREVLIGATPSGTCWAQLEPSSYTASYALLPSCHEALGAALGPRYRILLPARDLLIAYTGSDPWADATFVEIVLEAIQEDSEPGHPLLLTGALAVDHLVGTVQWEPLGGPSPAAGRGNPPPAAWLN